MEQFHTLANLFTLLVRTVMDRYRPPSRGGLVLSGSVPFLPVPFLPVPGQFTPEPERFRDSLHQSQNGSRTVPDLSVN